MSEGQFEETTRAVKTAVPADTTELPIRQMDWRRLYRKVYGIPRHTTIFITISAVLWGVGGSALGSLIPLYQATQTIEPWVKPTYWVIGVASCILGACTHYFAREREKYIESSCEEVMEDMREINKSFFPADALDSRTPSIPSEKPSALRRGLTFSLFVLWPIVASLLIFWVLLHFFGHISYQPPR